MVTILIMVARVQLVASSDRGHFGKDLGAKILPQKFKRVNKSINNLFFVGTFLGAFLGL